MSSSSSAPARGRGNRGAGAGGCLRVKAKLKMALEQKNFYEAHQMYRTLFYRLTSQEKFSELELLLYEGALLLFENGQTGSGVDLTKCFVETIAKAGEEPREEIFQQVARLYSLVPLSSPERDAVMAAAIKWSAGDSKGQGHPRMHQIVAHNLWRAKRYPESRQHFMNSFDGAGLGAMLAEFHAACGEADLFLAGTALQLACLGKHVVAAVALKVYNERHPDIRKSSPPYRHPLMNFVWLLLVAIERREQLPTFSILVEKYKASIYRDPSLLHYLEKIGEMHFGVPPRQRPKQGGLFGGLFDTFFNALNDDSEDSDDEEGGGARRPAPAQASNPLAGLLGGLMQPPPGQARAGAPGGSRAPPRPKPAPPKQMETEDLD